MEVNAQQAQVEQVELVGADIQEEVVEEVNVVDKQAHFLEQVQNDQLHRTQSCSSGVEDH